MDPTALRPRIVMTTDGGPRGRLVLDRINRRGVTLDAVLVLTGGFRPTRGRLLRWPRSSAGTVRRRVRFWCDRRRWYAGRAARLRATGAMNSGRLRRDLRRLRPDYLVLGGGGLLDPSTIATARAGVLNAHPALLPWLRGCGVLEHPLTEGVAYGATVHLVDRGIDTGPLIARRLLPVPPGPVSLEDLAEGADVLAAELMADVVEGLVRGRGLPPPVPQAERHPLYRAVPKEDRPRYEALARAGRAGELFAEWSEWCTDLTARSGDGRVTL